MPADRCANPWPRVSRAPMPWSSIGDGRTRNLGKASRSHRFALSPPAASKASLDSGRQARCSLCGHRPTGEILPIAARRRRDKLCTNAPGLSRDHHRLHARRRLRGSAPVAHAAPMRNWLRPRKITSDLLRPSKRDGILTVFPVEVEFEDKRLALLDLLDRSALGERCSAPSPLDGLLRMNQRCPNSPARQKLLLRARKQAAFFAFMGLFRAARRGRRLGASAAFSAATSLPPRSAR